MPLKTLFSNYICANLSEMQLLMRKHKYDLFLLFLFIIIAVFINYFYPMPEFSWDGNYYVTYSAKLSPSIRPMGYPLFLKALYFLSHSIHFVVFIQYLLYFISIFLLLKTVVAFYPVSNAAGCALGIKQAHKSF